LAESQLIPQELRCVKASGHPLVSDQLEVWSHLATAQGCGDGSKTAPLHCACWERFPGLRSVVWQGSFVTGWLMGATRTWLYLQLKRRYSAGAKDEAAATLSVVLSLAAEDVKGRRAHWAISWCRGGGHPGRVDNPETCSVFAAERSCLPLNDQSPKLPPAREPSPALGSAC